MKKYILTFIVILFFPLVVKANIVCNDGTTSPSCVDCHQGCCSHHGGCLSNYDFKLNESNLSDETIKMKEDENLSTSDDSSSFENILILGGIGYFIYYNIKSKKIN